MNRRSTPSGGRQFQNYLIAIALVIFVFYFLGTTFRQEPGVSTQWFDCDGCGRRYKEIIVHLDLKGAPVKAGYLKRWLKLVRKHNATGVLIEYEDMFPYRDSLKNISRKDHYTEQELKDILRTAYDIGLEVIPLIQSFGHVEFILKHDEFSDLRENPMEANSICPSDDRSIELINGILTQMRTLHPFSRRIHVGADEVYHLAEDYRCRKRLMLENMNTSRLKLGHIAKVASMARSAGFEEVFVWNDMFDKEPEESIRKAGLHRLVTPVVWGYVPDVTKEGYFPDGVLTRIYNTFDSFLVASAYKGANGQSQQLPDIGRYMSTHRSYKKLLDQHEKESEKCAGMILTGWSRYSHFLRLCELLPVMTPSLLASLDYVHHENDSDLHVWKRLQKHLNCPEPIDDVIFQGAALNECDFEGVEVHKSLTTEWSALEAQAAKLNRSDWTLVKKLNVEASKFLQFYKLYLEDYLYKKDIDELMSQMQRSFS